MAGAMTGGFHLGVSYNSQINFNALDDILRRDYGMPDEVWLRDLVKTFDQLRNIFQRGRDATNSTEEQIATHESSGAKAARDAVLPIVTVLPSGTFAMDLATKDEVLECIAFGTISPDIYHDMVWEEVMKVQSGSHFNMVVHEVDRHPNLRFLFRFHSYEFELRYYQCNALLRRYPEILTVPAPFLRNPENCASEIQAAVKGIQQCKRDREEFDEFPAHVRAYHYVRAWAIQRGLLSPNNLTSKDIITLCMESSPELHGDECRDFDAIVRWFFPGYLAQHTLNLGITPYPESNSKDLVELLERLDREPLHKKMGYSHYIRVGVMHAGCSDIQAGQWLSLVERRLEKLKGNIQTNLQNKAEICQWPYRLAQRGADSDATTYEGYFVFGINLPNGVDDLNTVGNVERKWIEGIEKHELTLPGQCFVTSMCVSASEFKQEDYTICKRKISRSIVTGEGELPEEELEVRDPKSKGKGSKKSAKENQQSTTSKEGVSAKLRTASDIHNRLKHDSKYHIDEYVIGYEDRVAQRILEKPVTAWARDTTDREFIPEQRVKYFKWYPAKGEPELVWDRVTKLDKIFGSGR